MSYFLISLKEIMLIFIAFKTAAQCDQMRWKT